MYIGIFKNLTGHSAGDTLLVVGALITVITGVEKIAGKGFVWAWVKKQFTYHKRINNCLADLQVSQAKQSELLEDIRKELNFNGSGSTKDAIYRIEGKVNVFSERQITMFNRQKSLINIQKDPMFITDCKGMLVYVNPAWLNFFGVDNEETVYQMGWVQLIPPENRKDVIDAHWLMIKNPSPVSMEITILHAKTKKPLTVFCRTDVYLNEKKELIEIIGYLDINYKQNKQL